jgi:hypothetical protein
MVKFGYKKSGLHGIFDLRLAHNDRRNKIIPKEALNFEYNDRRNKIIPKE